MQSAHRNFVLIFKTVRSPREALTPLFTATSLAGEETNVGLL